MSNEMNQLQVKVVSEGGALTVTPLSLLQYYLPGATQVPGRPNLYRGKTVTESGEREVYVHVETMMGALMDCKKKRLNRVTDIYILPANSPDKKSSHKVKYTVQIERVRKIPGFLGLDSGLIVKRPKNVDAPKGGYDINDTHGMTLPGDTIIGAWAEFYCQGLVKPIRHEVSLQQAKGKGPLWNTRESFMLCKVATDELLKMKISPMFAGETDLSDEGVDEGESVVLEAQVTEVVTGGGNGKPADLEQTKPASPFTAGTEYVGTILRARPHEGRKPGAIEFAVNGEKVICFFWKTPTMLEGVDLGTIITTTAVFSFTEKPGQNETTDRLLATFVLESTPEPQADAFDNPAGQEPVQEGEVVS